jgi:hypothetical protein
MESLTQAITDVNAAEAALATADATEVQAATDLDTATKAKATADQGQTDAVKASNAALDALIAAATAAKR